jgi:hypothetical protein
MFRPTALLLLPLLLAASAAAAPPVLSHVDPNIGFPFGGTRVVVHGSNFVDTAVTCPIFPSSGTGVGTCPVKVFFGGVEGWVFAVTPTTIEVGALPSTTGQPREPGSVDVRVVAEGRGEATLVNGFRFDPRAEPGPANYTPVLVPLTSYGIPGAHGSIWASEAVFYNATFADARLRGPWVFPPFEPVIEPGLVERDHTVIHQLSRIPGQDGAFVYIPNPLAQGIKISLRSRNIAEGAPSYGVEVPILRYDDMRAGVTLMDLPVETDYRSTLRIYGWTPAPMQVRVSVYAEATSALIEEYVVDLRGVVTTDPVPFPDHPAYAALNPISPAVRAAGGRVRIFISNMGETVSPPPPPIWAFVSITHNETQQVTIATPK